MHILVRILELPLVERKNHCSHLYQEVVYSLEQMEPMGLECRCSMRARKVWQLTGMNWS